MGRLFQALWEVPRSIFKLGFVSRRVLLTKPIFLMINLKHQKCTYEIERKEGHQIWMQEN